MFILLVTFTAIGMRALFNKINNRKNKNINGKIDEKSQKADKKTKNMDL